MPEIRSQTADTAAMAAIHQSLVELNTRTLTVEEMVRSQSLVNERTAASLERIFGVLEKLQEDRTTERRAEKQPIQSPLSGDSPPILPTPATPQHQQLVLNTSIRPSTTTAPLLKYFGNSDNEVPTEDRDVISYNVSSYTTQVTAATVYADHDTSVDMVFPVLQPKVTVDLYENFSYSLYSKIAVVDWNEERSCESLFGVVKNILKSRLTPVCENDSANVLSLFVTKIWCCIQPFVIATKPPPKPPEAPLNMLGQINQMLSIASKISCDMFKSIRFPGSSKKDAASTKCLVFVSWFISVYIIELSRFHLPLTECVKSGVSALLDVVALVGSIDEYGICITVGLKNGDKDEISCYFRHMGNNHWPFAIVVRSESKLLCSIKLERATGNTLWFSRLQTNAIFNELCKMFDLGEPSFVPQKEKGSFVMLVSLQGSGKTATWTRYSYYHQKIRWKTVLVFAAIQIVFSGCPHYVIVSVALCQNFSGLNLVLFMLTNGSTEAALLISYWAATMTCIVNFIEASMERCSRVLLIRNYYYFELRIFGHDQRFFWIHGWSLVVGDAWLQKLNYKSNHIFYYYRIGNMHELSSMVLLVGKSSELMSHGVFNANVIGALIGVVSKFSTYWLFQKACVCKLKIVAVLYNFSELQDEAMIIIKGGVDDRFLPSLTGIHCESLWYGCRPAMEQYHIFSNGFGLFEKYKTLFMPLDEADVLCTSPTGQQPTQGTVYDYYSQLNPSRQLQTQVCSISTYDFSIGKVKDFVDESNTQQTEFLTIELCVSVKSYLVSRNTAKEVIVVEDIIENLDALNMDISTDLILVSTRTLSVSEFVDMNTNTSGETIKKYSGNCPFEFDLSNDVMVQGCYTVLKAFTENMDMRLNLGVTKIYYGSDKVTATVEEGRIFVAHTLIITTSLGFLKAYLIEFEPNLLEWKIAAISGAISGGVGNEQFVSLKTVDMFCPNEKFLGVVASVMNGLHIGWKISHVGPTCGAHTKEISCKVE